MKQTNTIDSERQQMYQIIDTLSFLQGFELVEIYTMIDAMYGKKGYDYQNLKECIEMLHNLGYVDTKGIEQYWQLVAIILD